MSNLISNALKFTPKGRVQVTVSRPAAGVDFRHDALRVARGVGIPKDKQNLIWQPVQQADASISRNFGGTGLGLTISRELVSLLGGEFHLNSEEGHGSTFTFFLPEDFTPKGALMEPASGEAVGEPIVAAIDHGEPIVAASGAATALPSSWRTMSASPRCCETICAGTASRSSSRSAVTHAWRCSAASCPTPAS